MLFALFKLETIFFPVVLKNAKAPYLAKDLEFFFQLSDFMQKEIHNEANLSSEAPVARCLVVTHTLHG